MPPPPRGSAPKGAELHLLLTYVADLELEVDRLLVEQSGGTLTVDSGEGRGTAFVAVLPRYEIDDYLV